MSIHEARPGSPHDLEDLLAVPARVRGGDPDFIPPLRALDARDLSGRGALGRYAEVHPFIARDAAGAPIGRIAAIWNPRLVDEAAGDRRPLGQVGFFECVDDEDVSAALFEAGYAWLAARGARRVLGPMNGGAHRAHRLMTSGFERPPFIFEPRNPPAYVRLFERAGFAPVGRWRSYDLARADVLALHPFFTAADARARRAGCDGEDTGGWPIERNLARLHPLMTAVWTDHVGFAPFDLEELAEGYAGALALVGPGYVGVASEGKGKARRDVGFAFMLPNYAEELRAIGGDATRYASWLGGPLPGEVCLHSVALVPSARGSGAVFLLVKGGLDTVLRDGYERCIVVLVVEGFNFFDRAARATRTYALYGRSL